MPQPQPSPPREGSYLGSAPEKGRWPFGFCFHPRHSSPPLSSCVSWVLCDDGVITEEGLATLPPPGMGEKCRCGLWTAGVGVGVSMSTEEG